MRRIAVCFVLAGLTASAGAAEPKRPQAVAHMIGLDGKPLGTVAFLATGHGILITLDLHGLPPGEHAVHIHPNGVCEARKRFVSLGPHFSLEPRAHGYLAKGGPHSGDLPNQVAASDGTLRASTITGAFTLGNGEKSVFGRTGASIALDATADDYASEPAGNSGGHIACGVIIRTVAPHGRKGAPQPMHK